MLRSGVVSSQTSLSDWLRREMPRRGYPLAGHRAGGMTRLAADTGISQATMSRMLSGQGEPSVDSLRKIGDLWGYTLQEMMVHAGLAEPTVQITQSQVAQSPVTAPQRHEPGFRVERYDDNHLRVDVTVDTSLTMEQALKSLGTLSTEEAAMVALLKGLEQTPDTVAGAVLLLRGFDAPRTEEQGETRRRNA